MSKLSQNVVAAEQVLSTPTGNRQPPASSFLPEIGMTLFEADEMVGALLAKHETLDDGDEEGRDANADAWEHIRLQMFRATPRTAADAAALLSQVIDPTIGLFSGSIRSDGLDIAAAGKVRDFLLNGPPAPEPLTSVHPVLEHEQGEQAFLAASGASSGQAVSKVPAQAETQADLLFRMIEILADARMRQHDAELLSACEQEEAYRLLAQKQDLTDEEEAQRCAAEDAIANLPALTLAGFISKATIILDTFTSGAPDLTGDALNARTMRSLTEAAARFSDPEERRVAKRFLTALTAACAVYEKELRGRLECILAQERQRTEAAVQPAA